MVVSFRAVESEVLALYRAGDYRSALDRVGVATSEFTALGHRCKLTLMRACLLARTNGPDEALDELERGVQQGLWWSPRMLEDPDLDKCRGERLDAVAQQAQSEDEPAGLLTIDGGSNAPTLLALHGGGECVTAEDNPWRSASSEGWTVQRPVSGQRVGAGLATWTDLDRAVDQCTIQLREPGDVHAIGAMSIGASLALRLLTELVCTVPLVVMVAPSLRPNVVESAKELVAGSKIFIVAGSEDMFLDSTRSAALALRESGADVELEVISGIGHEFPGDFANRLVEILNQQHRPA